MHTACFNPKTTAGYLWLVIYICNETHSLAPLQEKLLAIHHHAAKDPRECVSLCMYRKFSRELNFAVFADFSHTLKIKPRIFNVSQLDLEIHTFRRGLGLLKRRLSLVFLNRHMKLSSGRAGGMANNNGAHQVAKDRGSRKFNVKFPIAASQMLIFTDHRRMLMRLVANTSHGSMLWFPRN